MSQYIQEAVKSVESHLVNKNVKLATTKKSLELEPDEAASYRSFISIRRWMVELQRVNVSREVSMVPSDISPYQKIDIVYSSFISYCIPDGRSLC